MLLTDAAAEVLPVYAAVFAVCFGGSRQHIMYRKIRYYSLSVLCKFFFFFAHQPDVSRTIGWLIRLLAVLYCLLQFLIDQTDRDQQTANHLTLQDPSLLLLVISCTILFI